MGNEILSRWDYKGDVAVDAVDVVWLSIWGTESVDGESMSMRLMGNCCYSEQGGDSVYL